MVNQSAVDLDRVFRALGDPSRRAMLERLSRGPATVSELAVPHEMSLAAIVQHLQLLEECGLIRTEKIGRVRTCTLEPKTLRAAERWVTERRTLWERRFDRLAELVEEPEPEAPTKRKRKDPS